MSASNSNIQLVGLDFDEIKANFRTYLTSQDTLKDANYEGSVLSILLDIFAYNTHYNAHYLNMVANEMFLDTAVKRSSVISHAKCLGYLPNSFSAPTATVTLYFSGVTTDQIIIPKNTRFITESIDNKNYTFVTTDEYVTKRNDLDNTVTVSGVEIKQGEPLSYSFIYTEANNPNRKFKIPDSNIDLSTLKVLVQNSSIDLNLSTYVYPDDVLNLNPTSEVYFLQETFDGYYEIYFGDGVLGKKLIDGNVVIINYLSVSSTIVDNISNFYLVSSTIGDYASLTVAIDVPSFGGRYKESISSIKYIAPKAYQAQERAITVNDYIALIQKNSGEFPIDSVNVWSGEENTPVVYGKIFVAIKPRGGYVLTSNQKKKITEEIIKPISVMTILPVVVDVDYSYLNVKNTVLYDRNKTVLSQEQLKTQIIGAINTFGSENLNSFNSTLILGDLIKVVNDTNPAIITNESEFYLEKRFYPTYNTRLTYDFNFNVPIRQDTSRKSIKINPSFQVVDTVSNSIVRENVYIEEVPTSSTSIESIQIINPGYGYTTIPTVTIIGDGQNAAASAIIINERIERIEIDNPGINYTQATVTITGGGGSLGSATVTLQNQYGVLRSYYFLNGKKIILNPNVGTVDYFNGKVSLTEFNIYNINNNTGQLSLYIRPDTSIITSKYNQMVVMDSNAINSVTVNLSAK